MENLYIYAPAFAYLGENMSVPLNMKLSLYILYTSSYFPF